MSEVILKAEHIAKQYRLGVIGTGTISHDLNRWWYRLRGKEDPFLKVGETNDRSTKGHSDYVWALNDINFEVKRGEVLGIIGKNGAGKSTLLKILSRVTSPTKGIIKTKGRIASLLEVGTGFHPEMTGRENIYLNGAILGMTKAEIRRKEEEIIDFSGCARYIDTPVKRYSSGMRVRLAFAVAAHLEPDILVVDEVLAVGDAEFQKKAVGKMQDISRGEGRTVLFVSHNMAAVKSLCTRAIVLENGALVYNSDVTSAVDFYLKMDSLNDIQNYKVYDERHKVANKFKLRSVGIKAINKAYEDPIEATDEVEFIITFDKLDPNAKIDTTIQLKSSNGNYVLTTGSGMDATFNNSSQEGEITHKVKFPANFFNIQDFYVNVLFVENEKKIIARLDDIISFMIVEDKKALGKWMGKSRTPLRIKLDWEKQ